MARLPAVLSTDDLPLAELCAARLDGEVVMLAAGWVPIDEPDLPTMRALACGGGPTGPVIERLSAAWVHGAVVEIPPIAQFCVPNDARIADRHDPSRIVREVAITADEIVSVGRCRVTAPARTAHDLARDPSVDDATAVRVIVALAASGEFEITEIARRLEASGRLPHKRLARARLASAQRAAAAS